MAAPPSPMTPPPQKKQEDKTPVQLVPRKDGGMPTPRGSVAKALAKPANRPEERERSRARKKAQAAAHIK